ncbi:MAG: ribosome maturation factor RimM [Acidobacteriota bacterium]|jgi:16S rRNA processing protein RimM|nr:ribosome maturation factor RimM [Acidobacteriota bacterium]
MGTPEFIAIAKIARTRGNRGEVLADLYTDYPNRFDGLREVWLEFDDGARQGRASRVKKALENVWEHKGRTVLKFAGVDTIGDAEAFAGCWVEVPIEQAVPLPESTYFDHDLVGCAVEDAGGVRVGTVSEVLHIADNAQLVIRKEDSADGREHLIPAAASICVKIDVVGKRITIDPPEGLMEL